jgi:PAS domain S-box-containing protein
MNGDIQQTDRPEILAVDDDSDSLQLLTGLLDTNGYRVRPASSGSLALRSVAARLPDLILLDVKMRDMDGYEVCRRLKADEKSRNIPIIFISGLAESAEKVHGFSAGGVDYISKPFQPEEVLARIKTHLRLRELTLDLEQIVHKRTQELASTNRQLQQELAERKRVEEEFRASETKYRIVADNTYDWEFWTDAKNQYVYISPSCRRMTGVSAEEFKANPTLLETLIHPEDLEAFRNHVIKTQTLRSVENIEFRIFDKEGRIHWIEHYCQPVYDERGAWLGTRGSNRDMTLRKETEHLQRLVTSILGILNKPAALTETINRVLFIIQQETAFDAVGLRLQDGEDFPYFASSGFPDDFLVAENSLVVPNREGGLCRDENGKVCLECTCGLVISGKTDPNHPLFTPGGSCWTNNSLPLLDLPADQDPRLHPRNLCIHKNFLSVALIPIRADHKIVGLLQLNDRQKDRLTREMITCFEDICASIGLTLMKKQAEEELKSSEARFRRLAENARDVIYRMSLPDGVYEYISPAATELFGYTPEEFYAVPNMLHKLIHPDWQTYLDREWQKLRQGEMPPSYEYQIIHKSGEVRWMNQRNILVRNEEGRILAIEGIVTDITDSKRIEDKLRRFNTELELRVTERTAELEQMNRELEQMNKAFVGRELRMVELKVRIHELEKSLQSTRSRDAQEK